MIVREGKVPILIVVLGALGVQGSVGFPWVVPAWLLLAWLVWIYRFPALRLTSDPLGVMSPVTGRVVSLGMDDDPFRDCPVMRIRLRPTWPGITLLRYPIEGQVLETYLRTGVLGATLQPSEVDKSPDCYAQSLRTDEGEVVLFAISSTWPVSRCSLDRGPGERAGQSQRAGFFYFASFVDVLVPPDTQIRVRVGQRVNAGDMPLGRLSR